MSGYDVTSRMISQQFCSSTGRFPMYFMGVQSWTAALQSPGFSFRWLLRHDFWTPWQPLASRLIFNNIPLYLLKNWCPFFFLRLWKFPRWATMHQTFQILLHRGWLPVGVPLSEIYFQCNYRSSAECQTPREDRTAVHCRVPRAGQFSKSANLWSRIPIFLSTSTSAFLTPSAAPFPVLMPTVQELLHLLFPSSGSYATAQSQLQQWFHHCFLDTPKPWHSPTPCHLGFLYLSCQTPLKWNIAPYLHLHPLLPAPPSSSPDSLGTFS